jgi:selenocysteine-specific elongation factor
MLLQVVTVKGEAGVIEGSFGKSGKLRIMFPSGISQAGRSSEDNIVLLYCKRYIHDTDRKRLKQ